MMLLRAVLNNIVKFIQCHELPGKYWLYSKTKAKCKDSLITYNIYGADFSVPWDQWCFWLNYGPENYYLEEILPFTSILDQHLTNFDFFDLGADVGVVSALVNKHSQQLRKIYAFEPNPKAYKVLSENIDNISSQHRAYNAAVSNVNGNYHFDFEEELGSDHEGHIDIEIKGTTQVVSLDSFIKEKNLNIADHIALKIDVEGQEVNTLKGASLLISDAKKVVLLLEIHPDVLKRDKETAEDLFEQAEKIREFDWYVPLLGNVKVDRTQPFFKQFLQRQYDVIAISKK